MEEAIFLLNFMFVTSDEEEWVERTSAQLEEETTLTYKQQTRVRDRLISLGLLEVRSNRVKHETFYRVVEERYDALVALLRRKREFDELTFGSNSTLPKGVSTSLPLVSSNTLKEEENNKRKEEAPLPLCKEERRALPKPVKEPKVRKGFQKTFAKREYVPAPKPPQDWSWFVAMWHRYTQTLSVSNPNYWEQFKETLMSFSKEQIEAKLSRWVEWRDQNISGWSSIDFLRDCAVISDKGGGEIANVVNEE